jgi:hypothetical protein
MIHSGWIAARCVMARQAGLFDVEERLREMSAKGDDLERVNALVDFEAFRPELGASIYLADQGFRDSLACAVSGGGE